ncbi:hypothetical protein NP233_g12384 [Leucocoprinus birnbaumii]|uniref:MYND-type domain-containing protein n=1 Tax=Leucocoprinus birnbaumii TaxID=56174 RepID=A0AAD5VER5_9AGAR|nr:hypothetical protein NP233_g12384 [Leucocoprinus birnbaumii]
MSSRTVYAPLSKLDKCSRCKATARLSLCSSCREVIYCSKECQREDWADHKHFCKQTEPVDLNQLWPFFAHLSEVSRVDPARPTHPALCHKILNKPIPNTTYEDINGIGCNPVLLGDALPKGQQGPKSSAWWSGAMSSHYRGKLFSRISREGNCLPVLISILVALMAEMYTTIYDPEKDGASSSTGDQFGHNKRFRLRCEGHSIVDFGICKGAVEVKEMDTFGYWKDFPSDPDMNFFRGQDPKDHYWIYFKTLREEFLLDLCMWTFNFGFYIDTTPYQPRNYPSLPRMNRDVGAFFLTREYRQMCPKLHWEKTRFSVLQNKELQAAVTTPELGAEAKNTLWTFMDQVAGKQQSQVDRDLLVSWTKNHRKMLASNLYRKGFLQYPASPSVQIDYNPGLGEGVRPSPEKEDAIIKQIKKLTRDARKGKISSEELVEGLRALKKKY